MRRFNKEDFLKILGWNLHEKASIAYLAKNLYDDITDKEWEELKGCYEDGYLIIEEDRERIFVILDHLKPSTIKRKLNTGKDSGLYLTKEGRPCLFIYDL